MDTPDLWWQAILSATYTGNILGVISLVLTVVGFVITIYTSVNSRKAAEEARKISQKIRDDMKRVNLASDISSALMLMEEVKSLHRNNSWKELPEKYSRLRRFLIQVKVSVGDLELSNEQKTHLQDALVQFQTMETTVEKYIEDSTKAPNASRLNKIRLNMESKGMKPW